MFSIYIISDYLKSNNPRIKANNFEKLITNESLLVTVMVLPVSCAQAPIKI